MSDRRLIEEWLPIAELGIESTRERRSMTALFRQPTTSMYGGRDGRWWRRGRRCWLRCCRRAPIGRSSSMCWGFMGIL